jgi:hypothetical protein
MGMKRDIIQETEKQQLRWLGHVMRRRCRIGRHVAEWKPTGNGGGVDQSGRGRMRLAIARTEETSRMRNVSIQNAGWETRHWVDKNCVFTKKLP